MKMKLISLDSAWEYYVIYDEQKTMGMAHHHGYAMLPPYMYIFKTPELAKECSKYASEKMGKPDVSSLYPIITVHQFTIVNTYIREGWKADTLDEFKKGFDAL